MNNTIDIECSECYYFQFGYCSCWVSKHYDQLVRPTFKCDDFDPRLEP